MNLKGPMGWVLAAATLGVALAAWQVHLASELRSTTYRIGFGDDPPFQFRGAQAIPTGVAVEIVKEAARRRGIRLDWVQPPHFAASAIEHNEVALWVLMTDLPQRRQHVYLSEPFLTTERCFLVLKNRGFRSAHDLEHSRIAFRNSWSPERNAVAAPSSNADELYLRAHFPEASTVPLPLERASSLMQALKDGAVDAALVNKTVVAESLLSDGERDALDLINVPDAIGSLSLGAAPEAGRAAKAIRDEIDRMAEDGSLRRITEPWGFFQGASLNIISQLADARRTSRMIAVGAAVLAVAAALIGFLFVRVRRERNSVRDLGARLISAQEQERTRLARDLHDDISQQVVTLALSVGRMKRLGSALLESGTEPWEHLLSQVEQIRAGVHSVSHRLHPAVLEYLGLLPALEALCKDTAAASGLDVTLRSNPDAASSTKALPAETALSLYRIAQEALQNAVKHSGSKQVSLLVAQNAATLELSVSDSGKGIPDAAMRAGTGLGLVSMRERARLMNGHLRIETHSEGQFGGTTVTVSIPLPRAS